jgi:ETFB lysine methyltransferase
MNDCEIHSILARLGPLVRENVVVEDETFLIERPSDSDAPLAESKEDYIPFWADLWPAARMLARVIVQATWTPGTPALELGCGLGLPGIVAMSRGLRVTFSDYDPCALHVAAANARLNGFSDFEVLQLDWHTPPANSHFSVVFGSDLIYEAAHAEALAPLIKTLLTPDGMCLLTDQNRIPSGALENALRSAKLSFSTKVVRAGEPGGRREKGTLYRISHE